MTQDSGNSKQAVVIGTSPIMLCAAITLAEDGWHVRAIEERDRPGGAWRTISAFGCDRVEPAVHLLENRRRTHERLADDLGVSLTAETRPHGVFRGVRLGLHVTRLVCFTGVGLKGALRGDRNKAAMGFRSAGRSLTHLRTPFLYPPQGSASLVEDLMHRASNLPIEFVYDTSVDEIDVKGSKTNDPPAGVCRNSQDSWAFDKIFVTSRAHARITRDGRPLPLPSRTSTIVSLLLHIKVPKDPEIGYVEVLGDDLIRRVRNVGRFARPAPEQGTMILGVQLRTAESVTAERANDVAAQVLRRVQTLQILADDAELIDHQLETFTHSTVPDARIRALAGSTDSVVNGLTTTDFAEDLGALRTRLA